MPKPEKKSLVSLSLDEKRRFIRHSLCLPLTYKVIGASLKNGKESISQTVNVSAGGLLFAALKPVRSGRVISIEIPFQDKIFNVQAKAVHCNKNPETKLYNIGVRFCRLNAAFKVKLIEQLYLISEYRDLRSVQLGKEVSLEDASREWIKRYSDRFRRMYW